VKKKPKTENFSPRATMIARVHSAA